MFKEIFLFELKLWFKKPSTYIFFLVFFSFSMLVTSAIAGLLGTPQGESNTTINSALAIADILNGLNTDIIGAIILISIIAPAVYKDFQYNTHPLLFTKPITKFGYMFGRFTASFLVALFVLSGTLFAHIVVCSFLGVDAEKLGSFNLLNYVQPFLFFVVPNTLLVGAIFFSLVTFSRNMIAGYVGCVTLILIKNIASALLADMDNQSLAAVVEPFGEQALKQMTKYWSPDEQNSLMIPFEGVLLYNRLLWFAIGLLITFFTYYRFQFSQFNNPVSFFRRKQKEQYSIPSTPIHSLAEVPKAQQLFTSAVTWLQIKLLVRFEFLKIVKSIFFLIIVLLCLISLALVSTQMGLIYGTNTYPVTYQILQLGGALFQFFMLILIVFYGGVLVWRERDSKTEELIGTTPIKNTTLLFSKFFALVLVQILLLFTIIISGVLIQLYNGYYKFELVQYFKELFFYKLIGLTIVCAFVISIQTIVNNKYVGYFVTALIIILIPFVSTLLDWDNQLFIFNSSGPRMPYSDMNGYGHTLFSFLVFKTYWLCFVLFLMLLANLFWMRGKEKGIKARFKVAKTLLTAKNTLALVFSFIVFVLAGVFIYYNTSILNKNLSDKEQEKEQADYEKQYKSLEKMQQPRIVSAYWNVDIFPEQRGVKIDGYYILKNKSQKNIDSIILLLNSEIEITKMEFAVKTEVALADKEKGFYIYKLDKSLLPGDSVKLYVGVQFFPKGFKNSDAGTSVVYNGTFFNSSVLPSIGYNQGFELLDAKERKKYDLPTKPRMASVYDTLAVRNNYISNDADWIDFECVLSTSANQTAIAPGYLQKQWTENGRNYFHYKMDCKILNFYSFLSAQYEVAKDKWVAKDGKEVAIEIYHHKGHEFNIDRMINGIKKSLDYYTLNFSPYQHKQVRILEFPRYATFAQSFPNTIPFSEGIGFIAKIDKNDPESIDYVFYVTAHEVAHQWWAHQVIGGNVQGATVMSETMSQYSALMVMEKEFGKQAMRKFLKYEMNQYLQGRAKEGKKEVPLMLCENQQYIHYNKGSIIMYALKDYIGEDSLNAALRKYIAKVAYQEPPYTTSIEFINCLKAATPDSLKYIITDMFETITLYENKTTKCSYTKNKEGKYVVKISVECKKMKADSVGKLKDIAIADYIDIGVFGKKQEGDNKVEKELYLKKYKIDKNKMEFEIIVDEEPVSCGIDPYNKLVDRTPDNNRRNFKGTNKDTDAAGQDGGVTITIGG
jgi:ABC-2 type transport system permease protein